MPAPALHFWDWNRPILQHAVDELARGWTGGELNLSSKLLIVPTAEAGRRLREALAITAAQCDGAVVAPWVWHPEIALKWEQGNRDAASAVQEQMVWRAVLSAVRAAEFPTLFPAMLAVPDPPPLLREWVTATSSRIPVKVFVHAPGSMRGAFDGLGCPTLDAWGEGASLVLPLSDESLHILSIPQEQAACAVARLIE